MTRTTNDERNTLPDERLQDAYRRAHYRVSGFLLRIGLPHPAFDTWLREHGVRTYVLLTSHNPRSTPLAPGVNEARHRTLLRLLAGRGLHWIPASGADPDNEWPEEHGVCLLDPPVADARELARLYEQHAIVEGACDGAPVLYWL